MTYELKDHDPQDYGQALNKIREWDYNNKDAKIPLGIFYKREAPVFEDSFKASGKENIDRALLVKNILKESV